ELLVFASFVTLNGEPLAQCTDGIGMTAAEYAELMGDFGPPLNLSDTPNCLRFAALNSDGQPVITVSDTQFVVWLEDNFDTSKPGSVSINDIDMDKVAQEGVFVPKTYTHFAFNQVAPIVEGQPLEDSSVLNQRPTFMGRAVPGSAITVFLNSG